MKAIETPPRVESTESTASAGPFMPVKEAVTLLPVSKAYLYGGLRTGRFPGTSFGRVRVLLRTFVEEFVARVEAGEPIKFEDYAADWRARNNVEIAV